MFKERLDGARATAAFVCLILNSELSRFRAPGRHPLSLSSRTSRGVREVLGSRPEVVQRRWELLPVNAKNISWGVRSVGKQTCSGAAEVTGGCAHDSAVLNGGVGSHADPAYIT